MKTIHTKKIISVFFIAMLWCAFGVFHTKIALAQGEGFKVGTFAKPTTSGIQTITGLGFQPKALIFMYTGQIAEGHRQILEGENDVSQVFGVGFANGTSTLITSTSSVAIGYVSESGASSNMDSRRSSSTIIIATTTAAVGAEATLETTTSDGFTLRWSVGAGTAANTDPYIITYIAFGAEDIQAKAGAFLLPADTNDVSVKDIGFKPDFVMFLDNNSAVDKGQDTQTPFSLGFTTTATTTIYSGAISIHTEDGSGSADTKRVQKRDRSLIDLQNIANTVVDGEIKLGERIATSSGFQINSIDAVTTEHNVFYLAIKGGNWDVGRIQAPTTKGAQRINGLGFHPSGVFLASSNIAASNAVADGATLSLGVAASSSPSAATTSFIGFSDEDGEASPSPDLVNTSTSTFKALVPNATSGHVDTHAEAQVQIFNGNGFTLDWSRTNATAYEIFYWAYGLTGTTTQTGYLFQNDNGPNIGSSTTRVGVSTSTPITDVRRGERLVSRIQLSNYSRLASTTRSYRLQFDRNDGIWNEISSTTEIGWSLSEFGAPRGGHARIPYPLGNASITCSREASATTTGEFIAASATSSAITLGPAGCAELGFSIRTDHAQLGQTYRLRVVDASYATSSATSSAGITGLDVFGGSYLKYPTLTIESTPTVQYSKGAFGASTTVLLDNTALAYGSSTEMTIGIDGKPRLVVEYRNHAKLITCFTASCTSTTTSSLDPGGKSTVFDVSLALDHFGFPVVAQKIKKNGSGNGDIYIARCLDSWCIATGTPQTVFNETPSRSHPSIIPNANSGFIVVAQNEGTTDGEFVRCTRFDCSATSTSIGLESQTLSARDGFYIKAALKGDGTPITASLDKTVTQVLTVTSCLNQNCLATSTITARGSDTGISLAVDDRGVAVLNTVVLGSPSGGLFILTCNDQDCSSALTRRITANSSGALPGPSIAIGIDGNPVMSYSGATFPNPRYQSLYYCSDRECANGTTRTEQVPVSGSEGDGHDRASLAIGVDGFPLITNAVSDTTDLYFIKCYSRNCLTSELPTSTTTLTWLFDDNEYRAVDADDTASSTVSGNQSALGFHFTKRHTNNTDDIGVQWTGQVSESVETTLELYNFSAGTWDVVASNASPSANTDFTLQATTTPTAGNYYNSGNVVAARVRTAEGTSHAELRTDRVFISFAAPIFLTQRNYQWFVNQDSVQPAISKANKNNPITEVDQGNLVRLRMDIVVGGGIGTNGQTFRLQYKPEGAGCSATESWFFVGDAGSTETWRMFDNTSVSDGATLSSAVLDGTNIAQTYEESGTFTNPSAIGDGLAGEWDFPIYNGSATTSTAYCFRIIKSSGTVLTAYTNYAKLTTAALVQPNSSGAVTMPEVRSENKLETGGTGEGGGGETSPPPPSPGSSGGGTGQGGGSETFVPALQRYYAIFLYGFDLFLKRVNGP